MRVIFTGDPIEIERAEGLSRMSTQIYGTHFPMSAEVDVSHLAPALQAKLARNPHFRVAGVDAPAVPLIIPAVARHAEADADSVEDPDEQEAIAQHAARARKRKAATA